MILLFWHDVVAPLKTHSNISNMKKTNIHRRAGLISADASTKMFYYVVNQTSALL
jgi:hypothetical protein